MSPMEQMGAAVDLSSCFREKLGHEMRTPMNAILGMVQIHRDSTNISEMQRAMRQIEKSARQLLCVIDDTLETLADAEPHSICEWGRMARSKTVDFRGHRALLVDDIEINREIVQTMLADTGLHVDVAENAEKAIEMILSSHDNHYDVVLMDIQMPGMNGYDATRKIRSLPRSDCAKLPILAMTANVYNDDMKRALSAGMNGHIGKPIDYNVMVKTINDVLENV